MSDTDRNKSALAGVASAALAGSAPKNLLGYEKVYHGTSRSAARHIQAGGLKKSKSGTGVGRNDVAYGRATMNEVKGKVYTTKNRATADLHHPFGKGTGETLTARVPYRAKHRLAKDHVLERTAKGTDSYTAGNKTEQLNAKAALKDLRIYKHDVKSRFIEGSKDYGGRRQFATKNNLHRYLSQAGGKARFAKGVAQAVGSAGTGMYAIAKAIKAHKDSQ